MEQRESEGRPQHINQPPTKPFFFRECLQKAFSKKQNIAALSFHAENEEMQDIRTKLQALGEIKNKNYGHHSQIENDEKPHLQ